METYAVVQRKLLDLERDHYPIARTRFVAPDRCVTGGIQFAALDTHHKNTADKLPVVCVMGINYTNDPTCSYRFFSSLGRSTGPTVESGTQSRNAVVSIVAAHKRNFGAWRRGIPFFNNRALASVTAASDRPVGQRFLLIMTNRCPFITALKWQEQVRKTPMLCCSTLSRYPNTDYFDNLVDYFGRAIDLWIGHSSIYGTRWVWPYFMTFVKRHSIQNWLLSPNISPLAHLYLDVTFRNPTHDLYPLFE